jgi:hypothetical protein
MSIFSDDWNWNEARPGLVGGPQIQHAYDRIAWYPNENKDVYSVNKYSYRSKEFESNADLVFSGCSMTYGEGVVEEAIWGNLVASSLNIKAFNLGASGASVQFIVNNLFNYFKEFGNPKNLLCLFPDFLRMEMYSEGSHMSSSKDGRRPGSPKINTLGKQNYHLLLNEHEDYARISQQPHDANNIIPKELPFALSLQYIKFLEMYCKESGINFLWGTWVEEQEDYIINNKLSFKNFIPLKNNLWHQKIEDSRRIFIHKNKIEKDLCMDTGKPCQNQEICHQSEKIKYGNNFDLAFDTDINNLNSQYGHYGAHKHIHWAEEFIKQMST